MALGPRRPQLQESTSGAGPASGSISVDADKFDQIVAMMGELMATQATLATPARVEDDDEEDLEGRFEDNLERLDRQTRALREGVMRMTLVPMGVLFESLATRPPRGAPDLETDGVSVDIERDLLGPVEAATRAILEALPEPEPDAPHRVRLTATRSADGVRLDVAAATARFDADALGAVHPTVEALGGRLEVDAAGTQVNLRIPLSLSIFDGQLVRVGQQAFVIPMLAIVETSQVDPERLHGSTAGSLYEHRDAHLPIVRLHERFGVADAAQQLEDGILVIVEQDGRRAALFVDEPLEQQPIVLEPLETNYRAVEGFRGACVLGSGRVAMVLDVARLVPSLHRITPGESAAAAAAPEESSMSAALEPSVEAEAPPRQLLTFELGSVRYGLDILRVQEIRAWTPVTEVPTSPLFVRGIINLRGAIVPILDLRERFGLEVPPYGPKTVVIILECRAGGRRRTMGVVVDAVSDVLDVPGDGMLDAPDLYGAIDTDFLMGVTRGDALCLVLDIDRLLSAQAMPGA